MLTRLVSYALLFLIVGRLFFRPQLRQLGRRIDRLVTLMALAVLITWATQILFLVITRQ
jgi:hypothetical protein